MPQMGFYDKYVEGKLRSNYNKSLLLLPKEIWKINIEVKGHEKYLTRFLKMFLHTSH